MLKVMIRHLPSLMRKCFGSKLVIPYGQGRGKKKIVCVSWECRIFTSLSTRGKEKLIK